MAEETVKIAYRTPKQLGWLRRPECDQKGIEVWEMPDGTMYAGEPGRTKNVFFPVYTPPAVWPKDGPVTYEEVP